MLQVKFFFGSDGMRALTPDLSGSNLPPEFGPWQPFKISNLLGSGQFELDAITAINDHGYFLFKRTDDA
ncbi:MAG: hypothetical protein K2X00_12155 [Nitrospiraceae bacterium]|nr:hypothetical protein [Nitrospiraceae bacterium]